MDAPQQHDLSTLFERLPIGAYRVTMDGILIRANAALLQLNGFSTERELRAVYGDAVPNPYRHPQDREKFRNMLKHEGQVKNFEAEMVSYRTGRTFWGREHAHLVRSPDGATLFYEGTVEDITAEREAKDKLRESESLLQNLLQTIPDPVWLKSPDGVYLVCNDRYADSIGLTPSAVVGANDVKLYGTTLAAIFQEGDQTALRAGRPVVFEESYVTPNNPNGELHEITKTPMFALSGEPVGVLSIARNIQARKDVERVLRDMSEQLELAIMSADLGRWSHDLTAEQGYFLDSRACLLLGRPMEESAIGHPWGHLIHPDDLAATLQALRQHLTGAAAAYEAEYRVRHTDGRWIWLISRGKAVQFHQDGQPVRMVGTLMDISDRKRDELRLRTTQAELEATLNALPDLLFEFDEAGHYISAHSHSEMGEEISTAYLIGKTIAEVLPHEAAQVCIEALAEASRTGSSRGREYSLQLPVGKRWYELSVVRKPTAPDEDGRFIAIARDITEAKDSAEAIRHLAFHDSLTGLPNRRLLTERLQRALAASSRHTQYGALMFLDLDQFKQLNDTHGHEIGDQLLMEVANRLQLSVRAIDTVARLGGDEFVVLIQELSIHAADARTHARIVGQKILASLNEPFVLGNQQHSTTPSIGLTLFNGDVVGYQELLKRADTAMYQAKAQGRNQMQFYE